MPVNSDRILIVDDETSVREVLSSLLAEEGYVVLAAATAEEGLEKMEGADISVALVDIKLPGMDGIELLAEIKRRSPFTEVVMMTSYASLETAIAAIRRDAYDYIQKPFKIEEIQIVTRNAIEKIKLVREKQRILEELRSAYRKLNQIEAEQGSRESSPARESDDGLGHTLNTISLFPRHTLPLALFEKLPEESGGVLAVLERLKDLRQQGIINDGELDLLKKRVLDRLDRPRSGAL